MCQCARHLLLLLIVSLAAGCSAERSKREQEVEVQPGRFLRIKRADKTRDEKREIRGLVRSFYEEVLNDSDTEWTELWIPWKGATIHWKGPEIPVSLRADQDRLFMIGYDQRRPMEPRFRYFSQSGTELLPISPGEFPRRIAVQNMWITPKKTDSPHEVDDIRLALDLDPKNLYFRDSITAHIWAELLTGQESNGPGHPVPERLLTDYVNKWQPTKLTEIIRQVPRKPDLKSQSP